MTVANRSPAPTVQNLPDNRSSMSLISRSATPTTLFGGFGLSVSQMALIARMTRSSMLEVLPQDYIRTAYAKGMRERVVLTRHALRGASIPIVTVIGMVFAALITGVIVIETVFAIRGIGRLVVDAVLRRDFPVVQGALMVL